MSTSSRKISGIPSRWNGPETKTPGPAGLYRSPAMSRSPISILRAHQAHRDRTLYWAVREGQYRLQPGQGILPRLVRRVHQVLFERVVGLIECQKQAADEDGVAIGVGKADRHRAVDQRVAFEDRRTVQIGQHAFRLNLQQV